MRPYKAIKSKNRSELESINNSLNQIWTSHETVIRNYDQGKYGTIEVNLMQLRVAVQKDPLDTKKVKMHGIPLNRVSTR